MDNIHKACRLGDLKLIKKVLEASPDSLNEIDPKLGWSPLYRCVICGHEQATAFLLAQGADPNLQNQIGESPLHQAADSCSLKVVQWLLEAKANPNLKQNGTNHIDGETALHKACARGDSSIVKALLDFKADPDVQNATFGWTPLHYCAETGNSEIWAMLLAYGASPGILDWHGKMPAALSPRSHPTISNRSTQNSAIYKPSPEPQDDTSPILTESFPPTPASSRSFSSVSGDGKTAEITKSRSRKGSPPLVPRLKLAPEKKGFHVSSVSAGNKSVVSSNASKSQDLSFSFRENYTKRNALEKWLRRSSLEVLTDVLVEGGYDDLDQMLAQAQRTPIAIEQLQSVGVKRRGHAIRLLAALELELQAPEQHLMKDVHTPPWECCEGPDSAAGINAYPSLQQWLRNLGLETLYPNFVSAGFEDLEPLLTVMKTSYALTEQTLETDFAIEKPGHRHRILSKLKEDSTHFDPWSTDLGHASGRSGLRLEKSDRTPSCELCSLM